MKTFIHRITLLFLIASVLVSIPERTKASNTVTNIAITVGIAGGTYAIGRGCSAIAFYAVSNYKYKTALALLAEYPNPLMFKTALINHINTQHLHSYTTGIYRNYPCLKYMADLNWYINTLWTLRLFHLGTEKFDRINLLLSQLYRIKEAIAEDFIRERRDFEHHFRQLV